MSKKIMIIFAATLAISLPAFGLCIKTDKANLRRGPGTRFEVSWQVYKFMPLRELRRKGSWIKVRDFENDTHWVHKNLVTKKFKCAVVKTKIANLRTGPGTKYPKPQVLPTAEKYMSFKLIKIQGSWAKVQDYYNDKFWVFRKLLWIN